MSLNYPIVPAPSFPFWRVYICFILLVGVDRGACRACTPATPRKGPRGEAHFRCIGSSLRTFESNNVHRCSGQTVDKSTACYIAIS